MTKQIFNLNLDKKTLSFLPAEVPNKIDDNSKKYFEGFIHYANNSINDIRAFLLENESCEKCFCWTCAFTVIGLIPFCCWICKKKRDRKEMQGKIKDCFSQCAIDAMKNLDKSECIIIFKDKDADKGNNSSDINCYYDITFLKPLTAKPIEPKGSNGLITLKDRINLNGNNNGVCNAEGTTQRNNINENNYNANNAEVQYKAGNYEVNNQLMNNYYNPNANPQQNFNQMQYVNVYQGNHLINNQLNTNPNLNGNVNSIQEIGYNGQGNYQPSHYYPNY